MVFPIYLLTVRGHQGWTKYAERRILEAVEGVSSMARQECLGWLDLEDAVKEFAEKEKQSPGAGLRYTRLDVGKGGLGEVDPDLVFSRVPYEKGYLLLRRIEQAVSVH